MAKLFSRFVLSLALLALVSVAVAEAPHYSDDTPVLEHGDTRVTLGDVRRSIELTIPPHQRSGFYTSRKRITQHAGNFFVVRKLSEEALERPLTDEERFLVEEARFRALSQIQLDHIVAREKQPDYEAVAREEWQAHPDAYQGPEAVRVSHILVKPGDGRDDATALASAREVLAKAQAGGDFAALAKEYSDDPSAAANNGDLGFFQRGQMVKPFEDAAFAMQKSGELVGPIKTQFGYHILRFEARRKPGLLPFEQVRDRLVSQFRDEFRARIVNREIERIGALEGVKTNYDALISLYKPSDFEDPANDKAAPQEKPAASGK